MNRYEALFRYLCGDQPPTGGWRPELVEASCGAAVALDLEGAFYAALRRHGHLEVIDAKLADRLRAAHAENAARAMALVGAAQELRAALARSGVPVRSLKGIALLEAGVIENFGVRSFIDLDVLTLERDREAVTNALHELGYRSAEYRSTPKHLPEFSRGTVLVEVHELAFWSRAGTQFGLEAHDREEHSLAFTLVHLVHHLFVGSIPDPVLTAKTLLDVCAVVRYAGDRPQMVEAARSLARRAQLEREVDSLVSLARALLRGAPLDAGARSLIENCEPRTEIQRLVDVAHFYRDVLFRGPAWYRRETFRDLVLPSRAAMESIYGLRRGSAWVYPAYLLRPFHFAYRAAERLSAARRR